MLNSKEDEDILKAEYLRNPKPDKAARMEIVAKVALGEKEVQVSFTIPFNARVVLTHLGLVPEQATERPSPFSTIGPQFQVIRYRSHVLLEHVFGPPESR